MARFAGFMKSKIMIQLSNQLNQKLLKACNSRHDYEKKLDYDLHQRKVLAITGIRARLWLKPVIDKHHGLFRGLACLQKKSLAVN